MKQPVLLKLEKRSIIGSGANISNWQEGLIEDPGHKILLIIIKAGGYTSNGGDSRPPLQSISKRG